MTPPDSDRRGRGFRQTGRLLEAQIRAAGESRCFSVSRLLTHWDEVAGPDLAALARPVKVSYASRGLAATLTVLTTGAHAPLVQAQLPQLHRRVNECYGYNAIAKIRITQTAPQGFAEPAPEYVAPDPLPNPAADRMARDVSDPDLKAALTALACNVLNRQQN